MTTKPKPTKPIPCPVCGKLPKTGPCPYFNGRWRAQCERSTKTTDHCITADGKGKDAAIKNWNRYVGRGK